MGVWIEILKDESKTVSGQVTPCVGVWIEIVKVSHYQAILHVTPCVGVWIEIETGERYGWGRVRHSLRGSVD